MRLLVFLIASLCTPYIANGQSDLVGNWDCALKSPGGDLRFGLVVQPNQDGSITACITNGSEKINVPSIEIGDEEIMLQISHYDSMIRFTQDGNELAGNWKKRRGKDQWVEMKFHGNRLKTSVVAEPDSGNAKSFAGRWLVDFDKSEDPAVAIFSVNADGTVAGTFLTTTGDYRYLHGRAVGKNLQLSCFDGAHAFLFHAKLVNSGKLEGDFWSSNTWHEKWTAVKNAKAALPDAFAQTKFVDGKPVGQYVFPDLTGRPTRLDDKRFDAKAKLIYVFGSWCPNCHDAAAYFAELKQQYGEDLSILGLAFELTGEFERDAQQVKKYLERHQLDYPVLIAGLSDKQLATKTIPFLDKVRSYPTTIFLDSNHQVKAIHTGFSGPATGNAYEQMKEKFESLIESMIASGQIE